MYSNISVVMTEKKKKNISVTFTNLNHNTQGLRYVQGECWEKKNNQ